MSGGGRRRRQRPPRTAGAAAGCLLAVAVVAGCGGGDGLSAPVHLAGPGPGASAPARGRAVTVLVADAAEPLARAAVERFARGRRPVDRRRGSPDAVARAVANGERVDAVVLPAGPALERIRDELIAPPVRLGERDGVGYWIAPVTTDGYELAVG